MNTIENNLSSPHLSSALRYERIAQLEAVLKLRDQRQRSRLMSAAVACVVLAAACITGALLWLSSAP